MHMKINKTNRFPIGHNNNVINLSVGIYHGECHKCCGMIKQPPSTEKNGNQNYSLGERFKKLFVTLECTLSMSSIVMSIIASDYPTPVLLVVGF